MTNSDNDVAVADRLQLENFPLFQRMGVKVLDLTANWGALRLLLPFVSDNQNPGGAMFGGAMAALSDPIAALACVRRFPGYAVWTKNLTLDFIQPGLTDLQLLFEFPPSAQQQISESLQQHGQANHTFYYGLYLADGALCARVTCVVAIRPRNPQSQVNTCAPN